MTSNGMSDHFLLMADFDLKKQEYRKIRWKLNKNILKVSCVMDALKELVKNIQEDVNAGWTIRESLDHFYK
ncbi:Uncharacterized protein FKW44_014223, partial [Caligus rogercresseyi]